jgi:hypothetical protein
VVAAVLAAVVAAVLSAHALHLRPQHLGRHTPHVATERFALPAMPRLVVADRDDAANGGVALMAGADALPDAALLGLGLVAMVATAVVRRLGAPRPARAPPVRTW